MCAQVAEYMGSFSSLFTLNGVAAASPLSIVVSAAWLDESSQLVQLQLLLPASSPLLGGSSGDIPCSSMLSSATLTQYSPTHCGVAVTPNASSPSTSWESVLFVKLGASVSAAAFTASPPTFATSPFTLNGQSVRLTGTPQLGTSPTVHVTFSSLLLVGDAMLTALRCDCKPLLPPVPQVQSLPFDCASAFLGASLVALSSVGGGEAPLCGLQVHSTPTC